MKKAPMIALLIVPYATLILCYQANLDITIGLCVYGALLFFNMVYAFLLPKQPRWERNSLSMMSRTPEENMISSPRYFGV